MSQAKHFSTLEDELLTDLVRRNTFLYSPQHVDYKNQRRRNFCWEEIAVELNKSCKYFIHLNFLVIKSLYKI